jgi:hypothetical protein
LARCLLRPLDLQELGGWASGLLACTGRLTVLLAQDLLLVQVIGCPATGSLPAHGSATASGLPLTWPP